MIAGTGAGLLRQTCNNLKNAATNMVDSSENRSFRESADSTGKCAIRPRQNHTVINHGVSGDWKQVAGLWLINLLSGKKSSTVRRDIAYGNAPRNLLDYYECRASDRSSVPVVLFFYGGNWRWGRKADYQFVAAGLCQQGFDVVIPDYRLYPDVHFDGILEDARNACLWVLEQTARRPVIVIGHSAGAQLGALLCLNPDIYPDGVLPLDRLRAFVGLAGPYDFYPYSEDFHYDLFGPEERYPESQPVNFVRQEAPPMYLLHGREDQRVRRGHSKSLMEKMQSAGGRASREVYDDMGHADLVLSLAPFFKNRYPVIADVIRFIQTELSIDKA